MDVTDRVRVDVWFWSLDAGTDETDRLARLLSPDESARAARFFRPLDRDRWTVSRGRTRELLAAVLDTSPAAIAFGQEGDGRPYVAGDFARTPSFNISHSRNIGALAISFDARVGVDVEAIRPIEETDIAWALSPAERLALEKTDAAERLETFFRFWTLKEAFMKGIGLGAALPLHDFDMGLEGPGLIRLEGASHEPARWRFAEAVPSAGMRGAVAARTDGRALDVEWRPDTGVNDKS
jgi:4'-phosphopantetheinyl transferase